MSSHWKNTSLSVLISTLESGKRPKGGVQNINSGIPSIGGEHLNANGGFNLSNIRFVPDDFAKGMKKGNIKLHDIIIVKDGATTGKTSLVRANFPFDNAVINEHVFICRLKEGINPKFVFFKLWSESGKKDILSDFRGAAQGGISTNFTSKVIIPLPPLSEQNRIVVKLEELFSDLDNGLENLKKAKEQLKVYRQSVLKWAFEGMLTNEDVKDGVLPEGWRWVKLGGISQVIMGQSPPGDSYNIIGEGMPLINGPVEFGPQPFSSTVKSKWTTKPTKLCQKDDLILCVRGSTTGRINLSGFKACIGRGVAAIRAYNNQFYLNYFVLFNRQKIYDLGTGSTFPSVSSTQLIDISIPVPSISEQGIIVQEIESRFFVADKLEKSINESLQQSEALRQSILKRAFEGRLVDNDE